MALLLVCKRWQVILKTKESNIKTKHTRGCQIEVTFFFFPSFYVFSLIAVLCRPSSIVLPPGTSWGLSSLCGEASLCSFCHKRASLQFCFVSHVTTVCIDEWCALRGEEAGARWHGLLCCPARQEKPPLCCFAGGFVSFSC